MLFAILLSGCVGVWLGYRLRAARSEMEGWHKGYMAAQDLYEPQIERLAEKRMRRRERRNTMGLKVIRGNGSK